MALDEDCLRGSIVLGVALALLMQSAGKVVSFASLPHVLERLGSMSAQLESCQRALNEFLEDKRAAFPRYACTRMTAQHAAAADPDCPHHTAGRQACRAPITWLF